MRCEIVRRLKLSAIPNEERQDSDQANQPDIALLEFPLQLCKGAKFCCAYWSEVGWM